MLCSKNCLGVLFACLPLVTSVFGQSDHWPQFRGPHMDGRASSDFPENWDRSTHVRWKITVPGEGWSGPVVWGQKVFLTTAVLTEAESGTESSAPEEYRGGGGEQREDLTRATYEWQVHCVDAKSGELIWRQTARTGQPPLPRHSSNTFATETPVTDGEFVYAYFGMTGLYCFDMDGELQWEKDLGVFEMRAGWGTSSSPVLFQDRLFLQIDNEQQSFLVALDKRTGEEVWRVTRDEPSQYSSPIIWNNSLRSELITGGQKTRAYDPTTGKELWSLDMEKGRSSATPVASGDRLFVGTELRNRGGEDDGGGFLFAVKPGGEGDITPAANAKSGEFVDWKVSRSGIQMASPVVCREHIYLLDRRSGLVNCLNVTTGAVSYRTRIPGARAFWSSPWASEDKVFCLDDNGTTHVLAAGDELRVLGTNVLDEQTWSSPAIADGAVFLRTVNHLYCFATEK